MEVQGVTWKAQPDAASWHLNRPRPHSIETAAPGYNPQLTELYLKLLAKCEGILIGVYEVFNQQYPSLKIKSRTFSTSPFLRNY